MKVTRENPTDLKDGKRQGNKEDICSWRDLRERISLGRIASPGIRVRQGPRFRAG